MADTKITALAAITTVDPAADVLPIVDVSDTSMAASGTTKKITSNQILGAGGTATLASATISGDLTVDTSTLKVDSANNRVGIVNASPTRALDVVGSAIVSSEIRCSSFDTGTTSGDLYLFTSNRLSQTAAPTIECQNSAKPLIINHTGSQSMLFGIGGSLQMTLNSTGLGVGGTPSGVNRFAVWNGATQAMTLDASGNLLVGPSTATSHTFYKNASDGSLLIDFSKSNGVPSFRVYTCNAAVDPNTAEAVTKFWRSATTSRSINAAGTVNASGADYAEYMTKASDFVLAKGDVAGIDANGKLTNVFADAVSFVVKSTDPSYVGNDKWGVGLEGDDLEAARQLVDRIAFAGQVPVNVTGAKAGDYIVPVVNGTGIKGQAVSNPTFEQYQLAVGKVISIDADGRARIIVKVA